MVNKTLKHLETKYNLVTVMLENMEFIFEKMKNNKYSLVTFMGGTRRERELNLKDLISEITWCESIQGEFDFSF